MTINERLTEFAGLPVVDFEEESGDFSPAQTAYRLSIGWDDERRRKLADLLAAYLAQPGAEQTTALLIGSWDENPATDDSSETVEALVSARHQLPHLKGIFLGELTVDECEISWINQSDVSPLFEAFKGLETLALRGGNGLSLGRPRHARLKKLVIEAGGLSGGVVREVGSSDLPGLEHLELWLGDSNYGNDVQPADLAPILSGQIFPKLRYLGLRNDENADQTAQAIAASPLLERIETLDLSLGTLGDQGAEALLASPALARLKRIDVHHHYLSKAILKRLQALGPEVNLEGQQEARRGGDGRYVAVSE